uniref:Uncharacterized protein n=1 Tax=Rhizophora mucronata TaxID=61149 RepID=A0A2P2NKF4_RHIMU
MACRCSGSLCCVILEPILIESSLCFLSIFGPSFEVVNCLIYF